MKDFFFNWPFCFGICQKHKIILLFNWQYNRDDFKISRDFLNQEMRFLFLYFFLKFEPLEHVNMLSSGKTALTLRPALSEVCGVQLSRWGNGLIGLGSLNKLCWGVPFCSCWVPTCCFPPSGAPRCQLNDRDSAAGFCGVHNRGVGFISSFRHRPSPEDMVGSAVSSDSSFLFDPSPHPFFAWDRTWHFRTELVAPAVVTQFERSVPAGLSLRIASEGSRQSFCGLVACVCIWWRCVCGLSTNELYLPVCVIWLNSKNLSLPREKNEPNFVLPGIMD